MTEELTPAKDRLSAQLGPNASLSEQLRFLATAASPITGMVMLEAAAENDSLRAALEVSRAATDAAVMQAHRQARTNAELTAQADTIRRLKAELCGLLNEGLGA